MLLLHRRLRGPGSRLARGAVLLAGLLAAGCGGRLARQFEWFGANPGAPEAVKKAVLGKKLLEGVGMTEDAVVASWGEPDERLGLGGGDSRWIYRKRQLRRSRHWVIKYTLIFRRGALIRVLTEEIP